MAPARPPERPEGVPGLGARLDDHHAAETNGRMAICRRCGARTGGPAGAHDPHERQMAPLAEWLMAQSRLADAERARTRANT